NRVVMASPFPEDQDERLVRFLAHDGIEVVAFRGLGCPNSDVIWALPPETGYDLATSYVARAPGSRRCVHAVQQMAHRFRHRPHRKGNRQASGDQYASMGLGSAADHGNKKSYPRLWKALE